MGFWQAFREEWDLGMPVGSDRSEALAIEDLLIQEEQMGILTVTPAYGRDYNSEGEIKKAWASGADFQTADGTYVNNQQVEELRSEGYRWLNVRYRSLSRVYVIKL
jgi:hypothetical protein